MYRWFTRFLRSDRASSRGSNNRGCARTRKLVIEPLESRTLLAVDLTFGGEQTSIHGLNVNVSDDAPAHQSEMSLDVNPANPLNLAGFSHRIGTLNEIDVFHSHDGGATWATNRIDQTDDGLGQGRRFDPSIAFDANGNLFVAYGHFTEEFTRLVVARSNDGGATFARFTVVDILPTFWGFPALDKFHLATGIDPATGNQAVYVAYGQLENEVSIDQRIVVSGSNDGALNFLPPLVTNDGSIGSLFRMGEWFADPAVGPNGEFYVSWHDAVYGTITFDADLDGLWSAGHVFGTDITAVHVDTNMGGAKVPAQPNNGIFTGPVLDVDRSGGTHHGRLYLAYCDTAPGSELPNSDIFLLHSDNSGSTWSAPIAVETSAATDFLPWVDVDQTTGSVNLIYYTTDNDPAGDDEVDVRLASSFDGGVSFPSKVDLTSARSNASDSGFESDFLEYIGLAVHDGTAHGLWSDNGNRQPPPAFLTDLEAYTGNASFHSTTNGNVLTVTGDDAGVTNDNIILRLSPANNNFLEILVNGQLQFAGLISTVDRIEVYGLGGNDTISVDAAVAIPVEALGGDGNDVLRGGAGADHLEGGAGNDLLEGRGGNDYLNAGAGDDTYYFAGSASLGHDTIAEASIPGGDSSRDTLDFTDLAYLIYLNLASTQAQNNVATNLGLTLLDDDAIEDVKATSHNDALWGNVRNNRFWCGDGDDTVHAGYGNDVAYGGHGDDVLYGDDGNDQLFGEYDDDQLHGGYGDDYLGSGFGVDSLWGEDGNDFLNVVDGAADDSAYGCGGYDTAYGDYGDAIDAEQVYYSGDGRSAGADADALLLGDEGPLTEDLIYGGLQDAKTLQRWREQLWFYLEWQKNRRA